MTVLDTADITARRCPRCSKKLEPDIGQHETYGDLRVRWYCLNDEYQEFSAPTVQTAKRTSGTLAELLLRQRLGGVEIPLVYDPQPFPRGEFDV